ncbi:hypothetical protein [Gluconobacter japonicus]|uniref:hypothetical protein n=1 Tax=Gluconobacter japonicus TaxID=376620 RepID=UPI001B8AEA86|nr:hypothetical protein [Gluconobacter japonicus]MBS1051869.1 hypothetical protein [Gluconobacter japonicus]
MSDTFLSSGQSLNTVTIGDGDSVYVGSGASTSDLELAPGWRLCLAAGSSWELANIRSLESEVR